MNCPTCGAQNDVDARFCAECGTPLENPDIEATIVGQKFDLPDDLDNDMTIMSTPSRLAEEAKTVSVGQDELADAFDKADKSLADDPFGEAETSLTDSALSALLPSTPEESIDASDPPLSSTPPPPASPSEAGLSVEAGPSVPESAAPPPAAPISSPDDAGNEGSGTKKIMLTVGGILLFFVILCCCCSFAMISSVLSDPNAMEDIMRELSGVLLNGGIGAV